MFTQTAAPDPSEEPPWLPGGDTVAIDGLGTLFVRDAGPAEPAHGAPPLLLLHGWGVTVDLNFFTAYPALVGDHRVVAFDHRGHGRGLRAPGPVTLSTCADDAVAVLDRLGIERVVAVGYSMGGAIAQLLWRRHPDRVAGLVLCSTAQHFRAGPVSDLWYASYGPLARLATVASRPAGAAMRARVRRRVAGDPREAWMRDELQRSEPAALVGSLRSLGRFRSSEWLGSVDVPTAVVVTGADRIVPPARQRRLGLDIPGATVDEVDGPHDAIVTRPRRHVPVLSAACSRVVAATTG